MKLSPWKKHVAKWSECDRCSLSFSRTNVVLARGKLPCDVLFIGEGPGESEDILGEAFIGPAGKLLDEIIEHAGGTELRIAFTNLVGCIPRGDDGSKTQDPPKEAISACAPRLSEFVILAKPKLIVRTGKLATKHLKDKFPKILAVDIFHPGSMLEGRMDISQRGLALQRTVVILEDAFNEIGER
jgi:uracil-DNA glycosylase family 4